MLPTVINQLVEGGRDPHATFPALMFIAFQYALHFLTEPIPKPFSSHGTHPCQSLLQGKRK